MCNKIDSQIHLASQKVRGVSINRLSKKTKWFSMPDGVLTVFFHEHNVMND